MVRFFINHRNSVWLFVYGKRKLKDLAQENIKRPIIQQAKQLN